MPWFQTWVVAAAAAAAAAAAVVVVFVEVVPSATRKKPWVSACPWLHQWYLGVFKVILDFPLDKPSFGGDSTIFFSGVLSKSKYKHRYVTLCV